MLPIVHLCQPHFICAHVALPVVLEFATYHNCDRECRRRRNCPHSPAKLRLIALILCTRSDARPRVKLVAHRIFDCADATSSAAQLTEVEIPVQCTRAFLSIFRNAKPEHLRDTIRTDSDEPPWRTCGHALARYEVISTRTTRTPPKHSVTKQPRI